VIELDNVFWIPEKDQGITEVADPFSNLVDEDNLPRLLRDYDTWCLDMRLAVLREGKTIGSSNARTGTRDNLFLSRLRSTPNYKRNLRSEKSKGKKQYERLAKEAKTQLRRMIRQYREGDKSFASLQRDSSDFFEHFYSRVWEAGRKSTGLDLFMPDAKPTRKENEWLRSAVREELKYWQSFLEEIQKDQVLFKDEFPDDELMLKPPRRRFTVEERLNMYVEGLDGVFENGRVSGMPDDKLFYWFGPKLGDKGMCKGCTYIVERQPFTKNTLPAVPRSGATPCLMNCRHKLVVREATPKEVEKRERVLPKRSTMVAQLAKLQTGKPRHKVKGKLVNPWQG
jgi:hypothetical protein